MLALIMAAKIQENTGLSGTFSLKNEGKSKSNWLKKKQRFICLHN